MPSTAWTSRPSRRTARRKALHVAARAVERCLNADTSDHAAPTLPCACGTPARYAGRRLKTFQSVLGELTLDRAYYHCAGCAAGFCPRDRALGLDGASLSPAITRMVGLAAAMVSFAEGSELMGELAGVRVEAKQVERTAEVLGREIAQDERQVVDPSPPSASTMYLGMDGTGVPVRKEELVDRAGKQPDGSAKTRRGQAGHGLERRRARRGRHPRARPRLGQLLGGHRERRQPRHGRRSLGVRPAGGPRGPAPRL